MTTTHPIPKVIGLAGNKYEVTPRGPLFHLTNPKAVVGKTKVPSLLLSAIHNPGYLDKISLRLVRDFRKRAQFGEMDIYNVQGADMGYTLETGAALFIENPDNGEWFALDQLDGGTIAFVKNFTRARETLLGTVTRHYSKSPVKHVILDDIPGDTSRFLIDHDTAPEDHFVVVYYPQGCERQLVFKRPGIIVSNAFNINLEPGSTDGPFVGVAHANGQQVFEKSLVHAFGNDSGYLRLRGEAPVYTCHRHMGKRGRNLESKAFGISSPFLQRHIDARVNYDQIQVRVADPQEPVWVYYEDCAVRMTEDGEYDRGNGCDFYLRLANERFVAPKLGLRRNSSGPDRTRVCPIRTEFSINGNAFEGYHAEFTRVLPDKVYPQHHSKVAYYVPDNTQKMHIMINGVILRVKNPRRKVTVIRGKNILGISQSKINYGGYTHNLPYTDDPMDYEFDCRQPDAGVRAIEPLFGNEWMDACS